MGIKKNVYELIITDGSDQKVVNEIVGIVGVFAYPHGKGLFKYKPLDENHPTMLSVSFSAIYDNVITICNVIEELYPGLTYCMV